jgi:aspartyl-tRNA synthetase
VDDRDNIKDNMKRTLVHETSTLVGKEVLLQGWVNTRRDHGKIMFLDLRDRSGIVQMVSTKALGDARPEDVIEVVGLVKERPEAMINAKLETGKVEVEVKTLMILSKSKELPMPLDTDGYDINEETRLKYRYLDLRRPRLQKNIKLRSKLVDVVRQHLFSEGFTEIETPMLTKSTPEGSRDFLVPSRLQPGKFYALPQSPQQYKQLLMVAGFERYFQIARCMRDEDQRADRGFEHTQIDIEMSFVNREDVMAMDEKLITHVVEVLGYKVKTKPFPVITYAQAMKKYGADKFDMRTDDDKKNGILALAWVVDFPFFEKTPLRQGLEGQAEEGWTFTHNPFSMPKPQHKEWLLKKERIGEILTTQYDLVCNGYEVGGGSIRGHEAKILETVFEIMGYAKETIQEQFGHMLEAFSYGVPPHGGLAHGIERLLMTLTGEPYLREVVAFPQSSSGQTSVMDAPNFVSPKQLEELGISVISTTLKDGEDVYSAIVKELEKHNVKFQSYEHEPVHTSQDAARVRQTALHMGAKALVFYADDKPVMIAVPGDKKVDMKLFKQTYKVKDLRMATPEEVLRVTSVPIGAVPPFGHIFGIPLYMDKSMRLNESVVFNAGLHTKSISLSETEYEKVAKPIVGEFSKD